MFLPCCVLNTSSRRLLTPNGVYPLRQSSRHFRFPPFSLSPLRSTLPLRDFGVGELVNYPR